MTVETDMTEVVTGVVMMTDTVTGTGTEIVTVIEIGGRS